MRRTRPPLDKFTRGFLAALTATVATTVVDVASHLLGIHWHLFLMLAGYFIFGHDPRTWYEYLLAGVAQFLYAGTLALGFAYVVSPSSHRLIYLKGWLFGVDAWFFTYAIAGLHRMPAGQSWRTAISHFISASVYGLMLAVALRYLDRRMCR